MKKLMIIISLLLGSFASIGSGINKAEADFLEYYCDSVNYAGTFVLQFTISWSDGVESIVFSIPDSEYHLDSSGSENMEIEFYDNTSGSLVLIDTLNWADNFASHKTATIDIDLSVYGLQDANQMTIKVPQTYTQMDGGTPAGYVNEMCSSADLTFQDYFEKPEYRQMYFTVTFDYLYNGVPYDYLRSDYNYIYEGMVSLKLYLQNYEDYPVRHLIEQPPAYIDYYDINYTLIDTVYLKDIRSFLDSATEGEAFINLGLTGYTGLKYFKLHIPTEFITSFNAVDWANRNTIYADSRESYNIRYYYDGVLIETGIGYIGYPIENAYTFPAEYVQGQVFRYFVLQDSKEFYADMVVTEDMLDNGVLHLYARFQPAGVDQVSDIEDPTPSTDSLVVGFQNLVGSSAMAWISVLALMVLTFFMVNKGVPTFAVLVVDVLALGLFIYLGLLPVFVTAIIFVVLGFLSWKYLGGVNYE